MGLILSRNLRNFAERLYRLLPLYCTPGPNAIPMCGPMGTKRRRKARQALRLANRGWISYYPSYYANMRRRKLSLSFRGERYDN
jgi:hypothetical protein